MKRTTLGLLVLIVVLMVSMFCSCTSCSQSGRHYEVKMTRHNDSVEIASQYNFFYWIETSYDEQTNITVCLLKADRSSAVVRHRFNATGLTSGQQADSLLFYEQKYDSLKRVMVEVDMRRLGY